MARRLFADAIRGSPILYELTQHLTESVSVVVRVLWCFIFGRELVLGPPVVRRRHSGKPPPERAHAAFDRSVSVVVRALWCFIFGGTSSWPAGCSPTPFGEAPPERAHAAFDRERQRGCPRPLVFHLRGELVLGAVVVRRRHSGKPPS